MQDDKTFQPAGDVDPMPLDEHGHLRDQRAMKPMTARVFVLRPGSMGLAGFTLYERSGQSDWAMANELTEQLAVSLAIQLKTAGATIIDESDSIEGSTKPNFVQLLEEARERAYDFAEHFNALGQRGVAGPVKQDALDGYRAFYAIATDLKRALSLMGRPQTMVVGEREDGQ